VRLVLIKVCDSLQIVNGSLFIWNLRRLLDDEVQNELPTPYCTLSDHTLPITDIICGVGTFPTCRILTSSVDHSVKVGTIIFNFVRS
jgi:pre-rRNA-processing protein IPI3